MQDLVNNLAKHGIVKSSRVREAMLATDRGEFVIDVADAYRDSPQPIGYVAATMTCLPVLQTSMQHPCMRCFIEPSPVRQLLGARSADSAPPSQPLTCMRIV